MRPARARRTGEGNDKRCLPEVQGNNNTNSLQIVHLGGPCWMGQVKSRLFVITPLELAGNLLRKLPGEMSKQLPGLPVISLARMASCDVLVRVVAYCNGIWLPAWLCLNKTTGNSKPPRSIPTALSAAAVGIHKVLSGGNNGVLLQKHLMLI